VSARAWIAVAVIAVGGTMWLWLPGPAVEEGGPLKDESIGGVRMHVPPGRARVEWVLLTNAGRHPVTLSSAKLGSSLRGGARLLGTAARSGLKQSLGIRWPSPVPRVFFPVDGYVIGPGRSASIAFGFAVPQPVRLLLGGVVVRYRSDGTDYRRDIDAAVTLCVTRRRHCHA
jgi:hypothetical protein